MPVDGPVRPVGAVAAAVPLPLSPADAPALEGGAAGDGGGDDERASGKGKKRKKKKAAAAKEQYSDMSGKGLWGVGRAGASFTK